MFFNFSNPFMIGLLILLIFENLQSYINNPNALLGLLLSVPGLLIAITFHEYAHAFAADKLGDDTPRRQGRLSLNPLVHFDPFGMMLMLFAGFGWGKPVQINPNNFNRKVTIRSGNAIVSFAGPAMNFILAILFSVIYGLLLAFTDVLFTSSGQIISTIIEYTITMNVGLGVFNLIPLPPLDGSKILTAFLPTKARTWFINHQNILYIIFLVVWLTPISSMIIRPFIGLINSGLIKLIISIASIGI